MIFFGYFFPFVDALGFTSSVFFVFVFGFSRVARLLISGANFVLLDGDVLFGFLFTSYVFFGGGCIVMHFQTLLVNFELLRY